MGFLIKNNTKAAVAAKQMRPADASDEECNADYVYCEKNLVYDAIRLA